MRNLREGRHGLAKYVFHGRRGELRAPGVVWAYARWRDDDGCYFSSVLGFRLMDCW
jgi:hypothetical protein